MAFPLWFTDSSSNRIALKTCTTTSDFRQSLDSFHGSGNVSVMLRPRVFADSNLHIALRVCCTLFRAIEISPITLMLIKMDSVYAGKASGPEPSPALCLAQAALLYGMPGMQVIMFL